MYSSAFPLSLSFWRFPITLFLSITPLTSFWLPPHKSSCDEVSSPEIMMDLPTAEISSIYPSLYPPTYLSIYLSSVHSSINICLSTHLSEHPVMHRLISLSIHLSTYPLIYQPNHPSIQLCIYPPLHLSIHSSTHVSTYPSIHQYKHWNIVQDIPGCSHRRYIGLCQTKSLRDQRVHADLGRHNQTSTLPLDHFKCHGCAACQYALGYKPFVQPQNLGVFKFKHHTNCQTKFCVYVILCSCKLLYVESSVCTIKTCVVEHVSRIRNKVLEAPLTEHFLQKQHEPSSLRFFVIEHVCSLTGQYLDKVRRLHHEESFWTHEFVALNPTGLNYFLDFSCFL